MRSATIAALGAALLLALSSSYRASAGEPQGIAVGLEEPTALLTLSGGAFDFNDIGQDDNDTAAQFGAEYRAKMRLWLFTPYLGIFGNTDGGIFGYGGLGLDIYLGPHVVITPQAALGGYREGDSKDLGGVFQFRTGVELAYRFENRVRLGLAYHHISNAGIHENNPGVNSLALTLSLPFRPF